MDVTDADAAYLGGVESFGNPHAVAQADVDGRVANVGHREVADADVFHLGPVDGFESQSATVLEAAAADGDVAETAAGFGAELDAACGPVAVGRLFGKRGARAVKQRAYVVAADVAVFYQHLLRGLGAA